MEHKMPISAPVKSRSVLAFVKSVFLVLHSPFISHPKGAADA
jgi:hypothetical protein